MKQLLKEDNDVIATDNQSGIDTDHSEADVSVTITTAPSTSSSGGLSSHQLDSSSLFDPSDDRNSLNDATSIVFHNESLNLSAAFEGVASSVDVNESNKFGKIVTSQNDATGNRQTAQSFSSDCDNLEAENENRKPITDVAGDKVIIRSTNTEDYQMSHFESNNETNKTYLIQEVLGKEAEIIFRPENFSRSEGNQTNEIINANQICSGTTLPHYSDLQIESLKENNDKSAAITEKAVWSANASVSENVPPCADHNEVQYTRDSFNCHRDSAAVHENIFTAQGHLHHDLLSDVTNTNGHDYVNQWSTVRAEKLSSEPSDTFSNRVVKPKQLTNISNLELAETQSFGTLQDDNENTYSENMDLEENFLSHSLADKKCTKDSEIKLFDANCDVLLGSSEMSKTEAVLHLKNIISDDKIMTVLMNDRTNIDNSPNESQEDPRKCFDSTKFGDYIAGSCNPMVKSEFVSLEEKLKRVQSRSCNRIHGSSAQEVAENGVSKMQDSTISQTDGFEFALRRVRSNPSSIFMSTSDRDLLWKDAEFKSDSDIITHVLSSTDKSADGYDQSSSHLDSLNGDQTGFPVDELGKSQELPVNCGPELRRELCEQEVLEKPASENLENVWNSIAEKAKAGEYPCKENSTPGTETIFSSCGIVYPSESIHGIEDGSVLVKEIDAPVLKTAINSEFDQDKCSRETNVVNVCKASLVTSDLKFSKGCKFAVTCVDCCAEASHCQCFSADQDESGKEVAGADRKLDETVEYETVIEVRPIDNPKIPIEGALVVKSSASINLPKFDASSPFCDQELFGQHSIVENRENIGSVENSCLVYDTSKLKGESQIQTAGVSPVLKSNKMDFKTAMAEVTPNVSQKVVGKSEINSNQHLKLASNDAILNTAVCSSEEGNQLHDPNSQLMKSSGPFEVTRSEIIVKEVEAAKVPPILSVGNDGSTISVAKISATHVNPKYMTVKENEKLTIELAECSLSEGFPVQIGAGSISNCVENLNRVNTSEIVSAGSRPRTEGSLIVRKAERCINVPPIDQAKLLDAVTFESTDSDNSLKTMPDCATPILPILEVSDQHFCDGNVNSPGIISLDISPKILASIPYNIVPSSINPYPNTPLSQSSHSFNQPQTIDPPITFEKALQLVPNSAASPQLAVSHDPTIINTPSYEQSSKIHLSSSIESAPVDVRTPTQLSPVCSASRYSLHAGLQTFVKVAEDFASFEKTSDKTSIDCKVASGTEDTALMSSCANRIQVTNSHILVKEIDQPNTHPIITSCDTEPILSISRSETFSNDAFQLLDCIEPNVFESCQVTSNPTSKGHVASEEWENWAAENVQDRGQNLVFPEVTNDCPAIQLLNENQETGDQKLNELESSTREEVSESDEQAEKRVNSNSDVAVQEEEVLETTGTFSSVETNDDDASGLMHTDETRETPNPDKTSVFCDNLAPAIAEQTVTIAPDFEINDEIVEKSHMSVDAAWFHLPENSIAHTSCPIFVSSLMSAAEESSSPLEEPSSLLVKESGTGGEGQRNDSQVVAGETEQPESGNSDQSVEKSETMSDTQLPGVSELEATVHHRGIIESRIEEPRSDQLGLIEASTVQKSEQRECSDKGSDMNKDLTSHYMPVPDIVNEQKAENTELSVEDESWQSMHEKSSQEPSLVGTEKSKRTMSENLPYKPEDTVASNEQNVDPILSIDTETENDETLVNIVDTAWHRLHDSSLKEEAILSETAGSNEPRSNLPSDPSLQDTSVLFPTSGMGGAQIPNTKQVSETDHQLNPVGKFDLRLCLNDGTETTLSDEKCASEDSEITSSMDEELIDASVSIVKASWHMADNASSNDTCNLDLSPRENSSESDIPNVQPELASIRIGQKDCTVSPSENSNEESSAATTSLNDCSETHVLVKAENFSDANAKEEQLFTAYKEGADINLKGESNDKPENLEKHTDAPDVTLGLEFEQDHEARGTIHDSGLPILSESPESLTDSAIPQFLEKPADLIPELTSFSEEESSEKFEHFVNAEWHTLPDQSTECTADLSLSAHRKEPLSNFSPSKTVSAANESDLSNLELEFTGVPIGLNDSTVSSADDSNEKTSTAKAGVVVVSDQLPTDISNKIAVDYYTENAPDRQNVIGDTHNKSNEHNDNVNLTMGEDCLSELYPTEKKLNDSCSDRVKNIDSFAHKDCHQNTLTAPVQKSKTNGSELNVSGKSEVPALGTEHRENVESLSKISNESAKTEIDRKVDGEDEIKSADQDDINLELKLDEDYREMEDEFKHARQQSKSEENSPTLSFENLAPVPFSVTTSLIPEMTSYSDEEIKEKFCASTIAEWHKVPIDEDANITGINVTEHQIEISPDYEKDHTTNRNDTEDVSQIDNENISTVDDYSEKVLHKSAVTDNLTDVNNDGESSKISSLEATENSHQKADINDEALNIEGKSDKTETKISSLNSTNEQSNAVKESLGNQNLSITSYSEKLLKQSQPELFCVPGISEQVSQNSNLSKASWHLSTENASNLSFNESNMAESIVSNDTHFNPDFNSLNSNYDSGFFSLNTNPNDVTGEDMKSGTVCIANDDSLQQTTSDSSNCTKLELANKVTDDIDDSHREINNKLHNNDNRFSNISLTNLATNDDNPNDLTADVNFDNFCSNSELEKPYTSVSQSQSQTSEGLQMIASQPDTTGLTPPMSIIGPNVTGGFRSPLDQIQFPVQDAFRTSFSGDADRVHHNNIGIEISSHLFEQKFVSTPPLFADAFKTGNKNATIQRLFRSEPSLVCQLEPESDLTKSAISNGRSSLSSDPLSSFIEISSLDLKGEEHKGARADSRTKGSQDFHAREIDPNLTEELSTEKESEDQAFTSEANSANIQNPDLAAVGETEKGSPVPEKMTGQIESTTSVGEMVTDFNQEDANLKGQTGSNFAIVETEKDQNEERLAVPEKLIPPHDTKYNESYFNDKSESNLPRSQDYSNVPNFYKLKNESGVSTEPLMLKSEIQESASSDLNLVKRNRETVNKLSYMNEIDDLLTNTETPSETEEQESNHDENGTEFLSRVELDVDSKLVNEGVGESKPLFAGSCSGQLTGEEAETKEAKDNTDDFENSYEQPTKCLQDQDTAGNVVDPNSSKPIENYDIHAVPEITDQTGEEMQTFVVSTDQSFNTDDPALHHSDSDHERSRFGRRKSSTKSPGDDIDEGSFNAATKGSETDKSPVTSEMGSRMDYTEEGQFVDNDSSSSFGLNKEDNSSYRTKVHDDLTDDSRITVVQNQSIEDEILFQQADLVEKQARMRTGPRGAVSKVSESNKDVEMTRRSEKDGAELSYVGSVMDIDLERFDDVNTTNTNEIDFNDLETNGTCSELRAESSQSTKTDDRIISHEPVDWVIPSDASGGDAEQNHQLEIGKIREKWSDSERDACQLPTDLNSNLVAEKKRDEPNDVKHVEVSSDGRDNSDVDDEKNPAITVNLNSRNKFLDVHQSSDEVNENSSSDEIGYPNVNRSEEAEYSHELETDNLTSNLENDRTAEMNSCSSEVNSTNHPGTFEPSGESVCISEDESLPSDSVEQGTSDLLEDPLDVKQILDYRNDCKTSEDAESGNPSDGKAGEDYEMPPRDSTATPDCDPEMETENCEGRSDSAEIISKLRLEIDKERHNPQPSENRIEDELILGDLKTRKERLTSRCSHVDDESTLATRREYESRSDVKLELKDKANNVQDVNFEPCEVEDGNADTKKLITVTDGSEIGRSQSAESGTKVLDSEGQSIPKSDEVPQNGYSESNFISLKEVNKDEESHFGDLSEASNDDGDELKSAFLSAKCEIPSESLSLDNDQSQLEDTSTSANQEFVTDDDDLEPTELEEPANPEHVVNPLDANQSGKQPCDQLIDSYPTDADKHLATGGFFKTEQIGMDSSGDHPNNDLETDSFSVRQNAPQIKVDSHEKSTEKLNSYADLGDQNSAATARSPLDCPSSSIDTHNLESTNSGYLLEPLPSERKESPKSLDNMNDPNSLQLPDNLGTTNKLTQTSFPSITTSSSQDSFNLSDYKLNFSLPSSEIDQHHPMLSFSSTEIDDLEQGANEFDCETPAVTEQYLSIVPSFHSSPFKSSSYSAPIAYEIPLPTIKDEETKDKEDDYKIIVAETLGRSLILTAPVKPRNNALHKAAFVRSVKINNSEDLLNLENRCEARSGTQLLSATRKSEMYFEPEFGLDPNEFLETRQMSTELASSSDSSERNSVVTALKKLERQQSKRGTSRSGSSVKRRCKKSSERDPICDMIENEINNGVQSPILLRNQTPVKNSNGESGYTSESDAPSSIPPPFVRRPQNSDSDLLNRENWQRSEDPLCNQADKRTCDDNLGDGRLQVSAVGIGKQNNAQSVSKSGTAEQSRTSLASRPTCSIIFHWFRKLLMLSMLFLTLLLLLYLLSEDYFVSFSCLRSELFLHLEHSNERPT